MSGLSKYDKHIWSFFIDKKTGKRTYNPLCRNCIYDCKQSFRAAIISCPKRKVKDEDGPRKKGG